MRFRLKADTHPFSEAVGVIQAVEGDAGTERIVLVDRRGTRVSVGAGDVLAAKVFPLPGEKP
jgi:hypothetical protein